MFGPALEMADEEARRKRYIKNLRQQRFTEEQIRAKVKERWPDGTLAERLGPVP